MPTLTDLNRRTARDYRENCTRCGNLCAVIEFGIIGPTLPALARGADELAICDNCVAVETISNLDAGRGDYGYVSSDGQRITTFGGATIARITWLNRTRSGFGRGGSQTTWQAITTTGTHLYGRNGGRGVYTNIRVAK